MQQNTDQKLTLDLAIIGAGVAGLWTANILQQLGFSVAIIESNAIGNQQTINSQGIIHGGLKYALQGMFNADVNALQQMPQLWQQCLNGTGIIDLRNTKTLANAQYLWSPGDLTTKISSFFASKALHSQVATLAKSQYPKLLQHQNFSGTVYQLNETIIEVASLLKNLSAACYQNFIKIDDANACKPYYNENGKIQYLNLTIAGVLYQLKASAYIFSAGAGNASLIQGLPNAPKMQLRPLHMVYIKAKNLIPFYGHCIGIGTTPRVTISTHYTQDGTPVWYLGGKLAEDGIHKTSAAQIASAKAELAALLPWQQLDVTATWGSFMVDRAEAQQSFGLKPETITLFNKENWIIGWPTKLVLAPLFATKVQAIIKEAGIIPELVHSNLSELPKPNIATTAWDQE